MRLYASEQEALMNVPADSETFWALPTDWIKTSSGQWIADSPCDFVLTADLTPEAGKNFVRLFAKMLFVQEDYRFRLEPGLPSDTEGARCFCRR